MGVPREGTSLRLWRRPLLLGAAALGLAGISSRIIGTVYRIMLVRRLGEEVLGIHQMAMPVFRLALGLSMLGIPLATAHLRAEAAGRRDLHRARRIRAVGLTLLTASAALMSLGIWSVGPFLAETVLAEPRLSISLVWLPLFFFPAVLSAGYRGLLQADQRLVPVAVAGTLEAIVRVPVVLFLASYLLPRGPAWGAGGVILGLAAGELFSLLLLMTLTGRERLEPAGLRRRPRARRGSFQGPAVMVLDHLVVGRSLLSVGLPVMVVQVSNSVFSLLSMALIRANLVAGGAGAEEATRLYGQLTGMVMPVLYMPLVLVMPLVQVLIPAISHRVAARGAAAIHGMLARAFGAAAVVAFLSAAAFSAFPKELGLLLYDHPGLGHLIRPLAVAAPITYTGYVAGAALYGLGETRVAMVNSVAGSITRLILIQALVSRPEWGIVGALWAAIADHGVTSIMNILTFPMVLRSRWRD